MEEPRTPPQPPAANDDTATTATSMSSDVGESSVMPSSLPPVSNLGSSTAGTSRPRPKRHVYVTLTVLVIILLVLVAWRLVELHRQNQTTAVTPPPAKVATIATVSPSSGSDNQSLTNDLNTISSGFTTENRDQSGATAALNDQQQEINVPTN